MSPKQQMLEMVRFASVGLFAVAIDFAVYFLLLSFVPVWPTYVSKAISWISGNVVSFIGNRNFVFGATYKHPIRQIGPFVLLYGVTLVLNNVINEFMLSTFGVRLLAWFVATAIAVSGNYLGMKFIVFKKDF